MLTEAADVNSLYEEALFNVKNKKPLPAKGNGILSNSEKEQNAKDYYANVRTNVGCVLLNIELIPRLIIWLTGPACLGVVEREYRSTRISR
jgi:hypothetical protein